MPRLSLRAKRRVVARLLEVAKRTEGRYVRALRGVMRDVTADAMRFLEPRLASVAKTDARFHALSPELDALGVRVQAAIAGRVGPLFDRHAARVAAENGKAMRAIGIRAHDLRIGGELAKRRDENIQLVEKAGRAYASSVREIFDDPSVHGLTVDQLKAKLQERADVSESRAELIARDQTLKLNGAITQIRQENAGVDSYTWSTSLDERVRPEHAALEGEVFAWSSPPSVGHPGQDINCRCVAIPVIEGLEDV